MRKLLVVASLFLFAGFAFGQRNKSEKVDIKDEIAVINKLMDKMDAEFENGDATTFLSSLTDDALICGTDPSEFWNKEQYIGMQDPGSDNSGSEFNYIDDRVVKVAPDGNSAIVVNQFMIGWSPNIPLRNVFHLIKTNEGWKVFFVNISFIPKNEHIAIINHAVE
jgi:ketosteroid isomerase-like protein